MAYKVTRKSLDVYAQMGARIEYGQNETTVSFDDNIMPINADLEAMPDAAMQVVTLCALADGTSRITGLQTLKHKETDRIHALVRNLEVMGCHAIGDHNSITIHGDRSALHGADIECFDDHRIAMSFAALGTVIKGVNILDPSCVKKTFPNFWEVYEQCRAQS